MSFFTKFTYFFGKKLLKYVKYRLKVYASITVSTFREKTFFKKMNFTNQFLLGGIFKKIKKRQVKIFLSPGKQNGRFETPREFR